MSSHKRMAKGFTLVEILIVVVILGILAAIVIPQFTNASESAKASNLTSQLQTIRSQLELYQVQHDGNFPTLVSSGGTTGSTATNWDQLTEKTDVDGTVDNTAGKYGPYLQQAPINPFEDSSSVAAGTAGTGGTAPAGAAGTGWIYDSSTGQVWAVISATKAVDTGLLSSATATSPDLATY